MAEEIGETGQSRAYVQPYADRPMDNEHVGEEVYISLINKATRYCWFVTPYLILTDEMVHAIRLAKKAGRGCAHHHTGDPGQTYCLCRDAVLLSLPGKARCPYL